MHIDTHLDTLWNMYETQRQFHVTSDKEHVDLERARTGELLVGFFTGYPTESQHVTEKMLSDWIQLIANPVNNFTQITSKAEYLVHKQHFQSTPLSERKVGALLHFEGAAGIDSELNRLYIYHKVGLRSMSLTWNETNQFATGVPGDKNRGLTTEGKDLLDAMQNLGVIIDVSHLNDKSFWDLMGHAKSPIIASHSNLRKFADHPRNLLDDMVTAIGDTGGSIGVNFCTDFLSSDQANHPANRACAKEMMKEIVNLTSIKNVHIGSDLDGCPMPDDIPDITIIPTLLAELNDEMGLKEDEIDLIAYKNMERIMLKVIH